MAASSSLSFCQPWTARESGVETVKQCNPLRFEFTIRKSCQQPTPKNDVNPPYFRPCIPAVPNVYVMDNFRDYMQSWFIQVERREHRFKRAAVFDVSEFGAAHVECHFIRPGVGSVAYRSFGIDKPANEPGARKPIHMGARPCDPALVPVLRKRDRRNRGVRRGPLTEGLLETAYLRSYACPFRRLEEVHLGYLCILFSQLLQ